MIRSQTIDISDYDLTRGRKRTLAAAKDMILPLKLRGQNLHNAEYRIFSANQPKAEARRILNYQRGERAKRAMPVVAEVDFSDLQELRVKLIRKINYLYPSDPQALVLNRMEKEIAQGTMTEKQFKQLTTEVLDMDITRIDLEQRKIEFEYFRNNKRGNENEE